MSTNSASNPASESAASSSNGASANDEVEKMVRLCLGGEIVQVPQSLAASVRSRTFNFSRSIRRISLHLGRCFSRSYDEGDVRQFVFRREDLFKGLYCLIYVSDVRYAIEL